MKTPRHSWIRTGSNVWKCTRCGAKKELSKYGHYGLKYFKDGKEYDKAPDCDTFNPESK